MRIFDITRKCLSKRDGRCTRWSNVRGVSAPQWNRTFQKDKLRQSIIHIYFYCDIKKERRLFLTVFLSLCFSISLAVYIHRRFQFISRISCAWYYCWFEWMGNKWTGLPHLYDMQFDFLMDTCPSNLNRS